MSMHKFLENLKSYGIGYVLERMLGLQKKIIMAVRETGLTGKLTLVLKFKRAGSRGIVVSAKITPVIPEAPIQAVEMFVDEENILHEQDPDQMSFDNVTQLASQDKQTANQV